MNIKTTGYPSQYPSSASSSSLQEIRFDANTSKAWRISTRDRRWSPPSLNEAIKTIASTAPWLLRSHRYAYDHTFVPSTFDFLLRIQWQETEEAWAKSELPHLGLAAGSAASISPIAIGSWNWANMVHETHQIGAGDVGRRLRLKGLSDLLRGPWT